MKKRKMTEDQIYQWIVHIVLGVMTILSLFPFALLIVSSFTDEKTIIRNGYSLLPAKFSMAAYDYLMNTWDQIGRAYTITILVTLFGTIACLAITSLIAYPLSRKDLPMRGFLSFFVFFTLLFNGGLVPTYLMYTQLFHLKNTFLGLLIPNLLMNAYFILLMKTFFATNIPPALIEAAKIDGAGEFRIYFRIILPLSKPIMATIGLFAGMGYWNDWYNGLIYLTNPKLFSIQNVLNRIITDAQFLANNSSVGSAAAKAVANLPTTTIRMAIAVVGILPIIIIYPFVQKFFVKGIAIGAVK